MSEPTPKKRKAQGNTSALCFKLPEQFDTVVRQIPDRSDFLKHCVALGMLLYAKDEGVTCRVVIDLLAEELLKPEDVLLLLRGKYLSQGYVDVLLKSELLPEPVKKTLIKGVADIKLENSKNSLEEMRLKARRTYNQRRLV